MAYSEKQKRNIIVIVDTGIDERINTLYKERIKGGSTFYIDNEGNILINNTLYFDESGHGSSVFETIVSFSPLSQFYIIKLQYHNGEIPERLLSSALSYIIKLKYVSIVNISMGIHTVNPSHLLQKSIQVLIRKNIFIVSASNTYYTTPCFPAYFDGVLGVGMALFSDKNEFFFNPRKQINILTADDPIAHFNGSSYTTAKFAALLFNYIVEQKKYPTYRALHKWLTNNSTTPLLKKPERFQTALYRMVSNVTDDKSVSKVLILPDTSTIKNVVLFSVDDITYKEIRRHEKYSSFNLVGSFDFYQTTVISHKNSNIKIFREFPIPVSTLAVFDSVFISNADEFNRMDNYKVEIITQLIKEKKKFIVINDQAKRIVKKISKSIETKCDIIFPKYTNKKCFDFIRSNIFLQPVSFSTTIGIIDLLSTKSEISNYAFQLKIKARLDSLKNYKVFSFSNDIKTILFNADFVFPYNQMNSASPTIDWRYWSIFFESVKRSFSARNRNSIFLFHMNCPSHTNEYQEEDLIYLKSMKMDSYIGSANIKSKEDFKTIARNINYLKYTTGQLPMCVFSNSILNIEKDIPVYDIENSGHTKQLINKIKILCNPQ